MGWVVEVVIQLMKSVLLPSRLLWLCALSSGVNDGSLSSCDLCENAREDPREKMAMRTQIYSSRLCVTGVPRRE